VDLPFEGTPVWFADTKYFDRKYGARGWNKSVVLSLSIGQADNAQTPISMAKFYTALATDGYAATPHVVDRPAERTPHGRRDRHHHVRERAACTDD